MKPKPKTKTKSKVKSKLKIERKNLSAKYIIKLATSVSKLLNTTEDVENFLDTLKSQLNNSNKVYYEQLLFTESDWKEGCENWHIYNKASRYKEFIDTIHATMLDCYFDESDALFERIAFGNNE